MLLKLNLQRFAPAIVFITINFDSHISKVTYSRAEWTASGQSQQTAIVDGSTGVFTVTLDSGYVLDTVTLGSDFENTTLSAKTDTSFSLLFGNTSGGTITITSKKATSQVSIDLTTLSGWGNVTSGNHVIQVVAKADNYRDSEKSTAVNFTKGSATVTLSAGTYRFNETLNIAEGTDINQNITGKMNTLTANNTYGTQKAFISISINYTSEGTGTQIVNILDETQVDVLIYEGGNWMYLNDDVGENLTTTDTTKLRTITIETDQQVSQEFKTWFDNNTNVVTDHTLTITNSSSSVDTLRVYDSNSGFQGNLLTTISKGSTSEVNIPTNYVYFACPNATEVFFTLSNVNPSNSIVQDSGGMDYIACKINQNGSCTITIG